MGDGTIHGPTTFSLCKTFSLPAVADHHLNNLCESTSPLDATEELSMAARLTVTVPAVSIVPHESSWVSSKDASSSPPAAIASSSSSVATTMTLDSTTPAFAPASTGSSNLSTIDPLQPLQTQTQNAGSGSMSSEIQSFSSGSPLMASQASVNASDFGSATHNHSAASGTLAGTAIACLVAGAALAIFVTWGATVYRRKHARRPPREGMHSEGRSSSNEEHKYVPLVPVPVRSVEQTIAAEPGLVSLPPLKPGPIAAASTIRRKRISVFSISALEQESSLLRTQVKTLFDQIEMHVDNFYHETTPGLLQLTPDQQEQVQQFETPHLEDSVAGVLPEAKDPRPLIKHCLAHTLISGIDFMSIETRHHSLLPSNLISVYQTISATASSQQQRQWRNDTKALIGTGAFVGTVNASAVAEHFTQAFLPWASEMYSSEARTCHLIKVIKEAVELGAEIFGRPADFKWLWQDQTPVAEPPSLKAVVVFPGLSMMTETQDLDSLSESGHNPVKTHVEVVAPSLAAL